MAVRRSAIGVPFKMYPSKPTARLFALAGAVYLAGAVGFEIVGNSLVGQRLRDTLEYNLWTLAEESLEMLGLILFLHTYSAICTALGRTPYTSHWNSRRQEDVGRLRRLAVSQLAVVAALLAATSLVARLPANRCLDRSSRTPRVTRQPWVATGARSPSRSQ